MINKNILIGIEFSIQLRNLVGSGLLDHIAQCYDEITIFSNCNFEILKTDLPSNVQIISAKKYRFRKFRQILFFTARYTNALKNKTCLIHRQKWIDGLSAMKYVRMFKVLMGDNTRSLLLLLCKLDFIINKKKWKKFNKYDVFISHTYIWQYYDALLGLYFQKLSKPWVGLVTSWDNPSSKGEFIFSPDKIIVWGNQNIRESIKYLDFKNDNIISISPPHFKLLQEVKNNPDVGLNELYIFYLGTSKRHYYWEKDLISLILNLMSTSEQLKELKLLIRPHPNDSELWWQDFINHPKVKLDDELVSRKFENFVYNDDIKNLRNFYRKIKNSKGIITYQSTTTIEAGLMNIPVLLPYFVPYNVRPKSMPLDAYPHLENLFNNYPKEYFITSENELFEALIKCTNNSFMEDSTIKLYKLCKDIANIEENIFEKYVEEINKILT